MESVVPPRIAKQDSRESLKDTSKSADEQPADGKQGDGDSVPFPEFTPKWPLTRSERIQELDRYLPYYEHSPQRDNIIAMKQWHAQFPPR